MSRVEIISASAGTGKTYRLAEILATEVATGRVRPEAVLATTFTRKAAAELRERVRGRLLSDGRIEEAHRLGAARIGTINSVCGALVSEYAFELGLQPSLKVMDQQASDQALREALSAVLDVEEAEQLSQLEWRMEGFEWQSSVRRIVDLARVNCTGPERFAEFAERSLQGAVALLGSRSEETPPAIADRLLQALEAFEQAYDPSHDGTQATRQERDRKVVPALQALQAGRAIRWWDWLGLANLEVGKKSSEAAEQVRDAAALQDGHPQLHDDVRDAIVLTFELARRTLVAYEQHKRERGLIDFVDQEAYALELLSRESLVEELRGFVDLVLVDEFQDTSPIQLAIFLKLAEIAPRSVWVGDEKQSIFRFRGAAPELMAGAIASVAGAGGAIESLERSYRSRPELVRCTSDLFAPPFAEHGIPRERVRIEPAPIDEPPGLGPVVERWRLELEDGVVDPRTGRSEKRGVLQARALAGGVACLLADETVLVRDRFSGEARKVGPGDVAVLCRTNANCARVAHELESLAIPAILPRYGLADRPEVQLALAGLRLYIDPREPLAMAQIARLLNEPGQEDDWLEQLLAEPRARSFDALPAIARVRELRALGHHAGVLGALDAVFEALDLRERCLAWGDSDQRLANLEALRSHGAGYVAYSALEGSGATLTGFLAYLSTLADERRDRQALLSGSDAVTVSTWHSAKGLEWPIVVLYDLDQDPRATALGVHADRSDEAFDPREPLAGRWIRFWPNPYHPSQRKAPFHFRLHESPAFASAREAAIAEELRLLYVGWTRARDRLVLAVATADLAVGILDHLKDGEQRLLSAPKGETAMWGRHRIVVKTRTVGSRSPVIVAPSAGSGFVPTGPRSYPPARLAPSALASSAKSDEPIRLGHPIPVGGETDMTALGSALHAFFAADRPEDLRPARLAVARDALARWEVESAVAPERLLEAGDRLRAALSSRWPGAAWHHEWPLYHRLPDGTVVHGSADLILETNESFVVIDHKALSGSLEQAAEKARSKFAGQLGAYAGAFSRGTDKPVASALIHLPLCGVLLPLLL